MMIFLEPFSITSRQYRPETLPPLDTGICTAVPSYAWEEYQYRTFYVLMVLLATTGFLPCSVSHILFPIFHINLCFVTSNYISNWIWLNLGNIFILVYVQNIIFKIYRQVWLVIDHPLFRHKTNTMEIVCHSHPQ